MNPDQEQPPVTQSRQAMSILRSLSGDMSGNMQEVLAGDEGTKRPPLPLNIRVRNLGRTIKERGEICQWINDMQLEPEAPITSRASFGGALVAAAVGEVDATANAVAPVATARDVLVGLESGRTTGESTAANVLSGPPPPVDARKSLDAPGEEQPQEQEVVGSAEEEPSFEEELNVIRQQRRQLLDRERAIQAQIDKKRGTAADSSSGAAVQQKHEQNVLAKQSEPSEEETAAAAATKSLSACGVQVKRRRFKGSLASQYAKRDEGTIGSLLFSCHGDGAAPFTASTSSSVSCVSAGREANLRQENSCSISEALSQTSFLNWQCYRRGSDSSETQSSQGSAAQHQTRRETNARGE